MSTTRQDARRVGLRMAAHVAAITGLVAAAAAVSQPEPARAAEPAASEGIAAASATGEATLADQVANALRVRQGSGCLPKWGPPAPPAMNPELLDLFAEEVAS